VAYQNLSPIPYVTKGGVSYNLQYDSRSANVQLIQQNAQSTTTPIYQDGKWNTTATSAGFNTTDKNLIHSNIQTSVRTAYRAAGGTARGAKLPQWAQLSQQGNSPGQTSIAPSNATSGVRIGNTTPDGGGIGDLIGDIRNPSETFNNYAVNGDKFGVGNEEALFKSFLMKYPVDMRTETQDNFMITQFRYRPSKPDAIFGGVNSAKQTLGVGGPGGVQPVSNLQEPIGTVYLPMPNRVADSNNVSWGEDTMSNIAAAVSANMTGSMNTTLLTAALGAGVGGAMGQGFKDMAGKFLQGKNFLNLAENGALTDELRMFVTGDVMSKLLKMQGYAVETESILARGAGIVPNSNLELLFNSPTLRQFTFTYRMSPRSSEEAIVVRRIIRFFKQGMAPKKITGKAGQSSFFLGTPNVFKLQYRTGTNGIDAINKFKTCALTSFSCDYTPDGLWSAYDSGQPVSTTMSMMFQELEPVYDTDYQENLYTNRGDLTQINNNMVGY
jgi:hypothetical protein